MKQKVCLDNFDYKLNYTILTIRQIFTILLILPYKLNRTINLKIKVLFRSKL